RMRNAKILVAGANGLSNELCKNIVLAGVGAVTLVDAGKVEGKDLGSQFFLREEDVGKSRAEASAHRIHELNPRVDVKALAKDIRVEEDEFFRTFDIVCVSGCDRDAIIRINTICQKHGIKFWAAGVAGFLGYLFCDLGDEYKFVREFKTKDATTTTECSLSFSRFADALEAKWGAATLDRRRTKALRMEVHPVFFSFRLLWEFWSKQGRLPLPNNAEDVDLLVSFKEASLTSAEMDPSYLPDDSVRHLAQTATAELSPVCAVLGGFLAQEVLKVLSGKGEPFRNFFCYDGNSAVGKVFQIPLVASKGKEKEEETVSIED
ncbi:hypothetical protein BDK51DRAFT_23854, partial [Blyttiomyces helicus]